MIIAHIDGIKYTTERRELKVGDKFIVSAYGGPSIRTAVIADTHNCSIGEVIVKEEHIDGPYIQVLYWMGSKLPNCDINHSESYPLTRDTREGLIDLFFGMGYNVMLQHAGENIIVWVDKYRFQQR